ncbi:MAG: DUF885 domain-containing protein [Flavobacteriaceae bacterium]|nr:DUF885 domain-containing protein [Flavobacteriaceae bacterium]
MKKLFTLLALPFLMVPLLFVGCKSSTEEKEVTADQSKELNEWFDTKYEEKLQKSPLQLTMLGRKDRYDQLDDMSLKAEEELFQWTETSVKELEETFDYESLSPEDQISYDLWMYEYQQMKEGLEFKNMDYVFHQMMGMHTQFPSFMINFHKVDSVSDMKAYITRIRASKNAINDLLDRAKLQAEKGIIPPKFTFERVLIQCKDLLNGKPFTKSEKDAALWADMNMKIDQLVVMGDIDETEAITMRSNAEEAMTQYFKPAYESIISWLEAEMPNAEEAPTGVSRHPNGEAYYNYRLKTSTTTNLTADEVHNIGLEEVARIQEEMMAIKNKVGFEGSLQEFFKFVNTDEQFFFPNTDEGRQGYLDESTKYLDELTKKLPDYFGILPKADLVVKRVESFREQDGAPQHYFPGTPDGSRSGIYYAHLSDMNAMPKTTMEGVAYHEGNPGHHMQISIAQELESVPEFRKRGRYTSYVEGWALYSEILAKEMGGYENPYYDFGRLVNEIWRAIRLVVDTGLHSKGWTEVEAIAYFSENSSIAPGAIKAEVQRYMVMPGQATAYKIGMIKIQELRQKAEAELGDAFDIKGFHDTVLGGGAMPLEILERRVNQWIDSQKSTT